MYAIRSYYARRAELDDLMATGAAGCALGADGVRDPHVALRVDVDSVRPDEKPPAETRDDVAVWIEFDDRIEFGIQAFPAENLGSGVTADQCRITSYNVCYTKLLRVRRATS